MLKRMVEINLIMKIILKMVIKERIKVMDLRVQEKLLHQPVQKTM
jgi:hypothetical protein